MKKTAVILLLLIYSSATMGATVHLHYCMDQFVGWSLWHGKEDKKCGLCGMEEKKDGCCKDEHKQVKLKAEHQKSGTASAIQFFDTPLLVNHSVIDVSYKTIPLPVRFPVSHAPPDATREQLYIFYCVFLI